MRRKTVRDVILLFLTKKKLTNKEISEELKISPSNVGWHIKRMKLNNLINEKDPDWTDKNSIQARWLINKLNNSDAKFKVIYFHHAPYSSSSKHGSDKRMQWPFNEWGADVVLAGYDHTYERIDIDNLHILLMV